MSVAKHIAYDVSQEMAKRIVEEAIHMERADALRNRLNMVVYALVDDDCWLGVYHIWDDNKKLFMSCTEDTTDHVSGSWFLPIQVTHKNIHRLLMRNCLEEEAIMIILYYGNQKPDEWYNPQDMVDGSQCRKLLSGSFQNVVFCQEFEDLPSPHELSDMVMDLFDKFLE